MITCRGALLLKTCFVLACLTVACAFTEHSPLAAEPVAPARAPTSQEQVAPPDFADCERILASPPVNQLRKYTDDGKYGSFRSEILSPALIGVRCRLDQIQAYMEAAGWVLDRERTRSRPFENRDFKSDYVMIFYLPDRSLLSFFTRRQASGQANYDFYQETLTFIIMSPAK